MGSQLLLHTPHPRKPSHCCLYQRHSSHLPNFTQMGPLTKAMPILISATQTRPPWAPLFCFPLVSSRNEPQASPTAHLGALSTWDLLGLGHLWCELSSLSLALCLEQSQLFLPNPETLIRPRETLFSKTKMRPYHCKYDRSIRDLNLVLEKRMSWRAQESISP